MELIEKLIKAGYEKQIREIESMFIDSIHLTTTKAKEEDFRLGESKIGKPLIFLRILSVQHTMISL